VSAEGAYPADQSNAKEMVGYEGISAFTRVFDAP
jgi:hypothetical protein